MVHLIHNGIRLLCGSDVSVFLPAARIGFRHIDNCRTLTVSAHCFRPSTRGFGKPNTFYLNLKSIEFAIKFVGKRGCPSTRLCLFHIDGLNRFAVARSGIKIQANGFSAGRPKAKMRATGVDGKFQIAAVVCRIGVQFRFGNLRKRLCGNGHRHKCRCCESRSGNQSD